MLCACLSGRSAKAPEKQNNSRERSHITAVTHTDANWWQHVRSEFEFSALRCWPHMWSSVISWIYDII